MKFLLTPTFYGPALTGLLGVLTWLLVSWANPKDDSVTGTLRVIFGQHGRTVLVSVLVYFGACVAMNASDTLNLASALGAGYGIQSLTEKMTGFGKSGG
jgi:hypothetical protein